MRFESRQSCCWTAVIYIQAKILSSIRCNSGQEPKDSEPLRFITAVIAAHCFSLLQSLLRIASHYFSHYCSIQPVDPEYCSIATLITTHYFSHYFIVTSFITSYYFSSNGFITSYYFGSNGSITSYYFSSNGVITSYYYWSVMGSNGVITSYY